MLREDINELRLLNISETKIEKQLKKIIFIFIIIVIPIIEIINIIFETINIFERFEINGKKNYINSEGFHGVVVVLCNLGSLFCTWGLMSVCYYNYQCILILIIIKSVFIFIFLLINKISDNFHYYLVFNVIIYGIYYTLIIIYRVFKKGIF